jgi:hypothetical protein
MTRRPLALGAALAILAAATSLPVGASQVLPLPSLPGQPAPAPAAPPGVSLPPELDTPGIAASPCTFSPLGAGEFRLISQDYGTTMPDAPTVDPHRPCRMVALQSKYFRDDRVIRFEKAGFWSPVLEPVRPAGVAVTSGVQWDAPAVAADGTILVGDRGVNLQSTLTDAWAGFAGIRVSHDWGRTWTEADSGILPGIGRPPSIKSITVAPSDSREAFAIVPSPDDLGLLYTTHDGAATWSLAHLALKETSGFVAVDPTDARNVIVFDPSGDAWRSSDGGSSWTIARTTTTPLLDAGPWEVCAASAAHTAAGFVAYVKVGMPRASGACDTWVRTTDGVTYTPLPAPVDSGSVLTVDGGDHTTLVYGSLENAGGRAQAIRLLASKDEFRTTDAGRSLPIPGANAELLGLSADASSDFFVDVHTSVNYVPTSDIVAFRTTALRAVAGQTAPSQLGFPGPPALPSGPSVPEVRTCPLPPPPVGSAADNSLGSSGSVTFDGDFLDVSYTENTVDGVPLNPGAGRGLGVAGVIFRMRPDCSSAPPLHLAAVDFPGGLLPRVDALTYDSRLTLPDGGQGALVVKGGNNDDARFPDAVPVYAVSPVSGHSWPLFATVAPSFANDPDLLAYDPAADAFWINTPPDGQAGLVTARGQPIQTCMTEALASFGLFSPDGGGPSAFVPAGTGVGYVQTEDDLNVFRIDTASCTLLSGFSHRLYSESSDENDQMACDSLTFTSGDAGSSVLWLRDAQPDTISAYPVPQGYCPFPTSLAYTGTPAAVAGSTAELCADLSAQRAGQRHPLGDELVHFSVDGRVAGAAPTDALGRSCVATTAPPAGVHRVHATFAGTRAYAPSDADGTLVTTATVTSAPPATGAALLPGGTGLQPPSSEPQTSTGPQLSGQVEEQIASQAQAQSQSQSQAQASTHLQPALMTQRRTREQVAAQTMTAPRTQPESMLASRRQPASPYAEATLFGGALLLGLAMLRRRPRVAIAPARRQRRG